jgi:hypothetical protein
VVLRLLWEPHTKLLRRSHWSYVFMAITTPVLPPAPTPQLLRDVNTTLSVIKKLSGDPYGCETSRLPHFLDNRLTDGGEVVSLTPRAPFNPTKIPGTHFCQRFSRSPGHGVAGRIR